MTQRASAVAHLRNFAFVLLALLGLTPQAHAASELLLLQATSLGTNTPAESTHLPHSRAGRVALHATEHEFGGGRPPAGPKGRGWAGGGNHHLGMPKDLVSGDGLVVWK